MTKDEKIILVLGGVMLGAIILYHLTNTPDNAAEIQVDESGIIPTMSQTMAGAQSGKVRAYIGYNSPFLFAPPIGNVMPPQIGPGTHAVTADPNFSLGNWSD